MSRVIKQLIKDLQLTLQRSYHVKVMEQEQRKQENISQQSKKKQKKKL